MLKGRHTAIVVSILLHLLLIAGVSTFSTPRLKKVQVDNKTIPIKSFLYQKPNIPKKETVKEQPKKTEQLEEVAENTEDSEEKRLYETPIVSLEKAIETSTEQTEVPRLEVPTKWATKTVSSPMAQPPAKTNITPVQNESVKTPRFNVGAQLKSLRSKISDETMTKAFKEYSQYRSVSGMHPNPIAVHRSSPKLSAEQEKELKTSHYSSELSITKLDNGACSMTQDLSNIGMEGIKAVSYFSCGESDFDKAFRKHMKKVSDKTKPIQ